MTDKQKQVLENFDGLEVVAWGIVASNTGRMCQVELNADEVEGHKQQYIRPLVTLASAQAAVAARDKLILEAYPLIKESGERITALESALGVARDALNAVSGKGPLCNAALKAINEALK